MILPVARPIVDTDRGHAVRSIAWERHLCSHIPYLIWSIAVALFVIPCVLPRLLLLISVTVAAIAFALILHDHHRHELDGGVAQTLDLLIVLW